MSRMVDVNPRMTPLTQCPGTPAFMAPEALLAEPVYTDKLDVFSAGVLAIQVMTHRFPMPTKSKQLQNFPGSPTGVIEVPVPERERRKDDLDRIASTHPLLPTALRCIKDRDRERPSAAQLCQSLAALKEAPAYAESVQERPGDAASLQQTRASLEEKERENRDLRRQLVQNEEQLQETVQQLAEKEDSIRAKDQALMTNEQTIRAKDQEIRAKDEEIRAKDQQLRGKEEEVGDLRRQLQETVQQLAEKEDSIRAKDQALRANEQAIRTNEQEIRAKDEEIRAKDQQLRGKEREVGDLRREVADMQQLLAQFQRQLLEESELKGLPQRMQSKAKITEVKIDIHDLQSLTLNSNSSV